MKAAKTLPITSLFASDARTSGSVPMNCAKSCTAGRGHFMGEKCVGLKILLT